MSLNKLQISFILFLYLCLFSTATLAEEHHSDTLSFKTLQVSDNIWTLQGKGRNIAILTGEDGFVTPK